MGWADCGYDSQGRPIGYASDAICDYPGCSVEIHRGLSHACGGMHGEQGADCEKYFCEEHLHGVCDHDSEISSPQLCADCYKYWEENHPDCEECGKCAMERAIMIKGDQ